MSIFTKIMNSVFGKPEPIRVVVLGMDSAGKSTILYKLRAYGEEIVDTYPTIGFNIETLEKRDMTMTCWDVGGCDKIRPLWKHFCENMSVLVYVIDAYDRDRLPPAADEFNYFLNDSTVAPTLPILVIANKQDYPKAMSITEITEKMDLHNKLRGRQWCVIPCCAASGDGVADIVQWIKSAVSDKTFSLRQSEPQEPSAAPTECFGKTQQGMRTSPGTAASNNESAVPSALDFDTAARNKDVTAEVAAAKATEREVTRQSLLEDWLRRAQEEAAAAPSEEEMRAADDAFIAAIEDASLPMWDHYTHIKLGFLVLLSANLETADRQREESYSFDMAVHRVCGLIEGFIARSSRTNGRSFHCTMTYFWCHMIAVQLSRVTTAHISSASGGRGDGSVSFVSFIESLQSVEAIELWDGKLFSKYYSSPVMFGGDARNQFVAPDLQPFPAL